MSAIYTWGLLAETSGEVAVVRQEGKNEVFLNACTLYEDLTIAPQGLLMTVGA